MLAVRSALATSDVARTRLTSRDRCVNASDHAGRPCPMSADGYLNDSDDIEGHIRRRQCMKTTKDNCSQHLKLVDHYVHAKGYIGRLHLMSSNHCV